VEVQTATFGMSPEEFTDMSGYSCAFACLLEFVDSKPPTLRNKAQSRKAQRVSFTASHASKQSSKLKAPKEREVNVEGDG